MHRQLKDHEHLTKRELHIISMAIDILGRVQEVNERVLSEHMPEDVQYFKNSQKKMENQTT